MHTTAGQVAGRVNPSDLNTLMYKTAGQVADRVIVGPQSGVQSIQELSQATVNNVAQTLNQMQDQNDIFAVSNEAINHVAFKINSLSEGQTLEQVSNQAAGNIATQVNNHKVKIEGSSYLYSFLYYTVIFGVIKAALFAVYYNVYLDEPGRTQVQQKFQDFVDIPKPLLGSNALSKKSYRPFDDEGGVELR
jgi:hypothetical protein